MVRLLLIALLTLLGCGDESGSSSTSLAHRWQPVELTCDVPVIDENPFDQQGQTVQLEIQPPATASYRIDAFVTRNYERSLVGGYEHLAPTSDLEWRARFTPTEEGTWQWRCVTRSDQNEQPGSWQRLRVGGPEPDSHGFLRRSKRDRRYLEFDDSTPFFAVGENLCWYDGRGTFAYDDWIEQLAARRVNYIRLWMPSWAFGLEWITRGEGGAVLSSSLGNYETRLDRAWQLDAVIELARRQGIQVMLAIQNHGAFSLSSNSEWVDNPYNAANGGPLDSPREFFSNPQARELFKRRLRYIVARWGYATNLLAWELWNEVDLAEQPAIDEVLGWHTEMADHLRALDPYDHLISTSTSQADALNPGSPFGALWALPGIDFSQVHFYSFGGAAVDFTQVFPRAVNRLRRYAKPVLIAEAGVDFRGPAETIESDPNGDGFHDLLWAAPFAGAFGSGMSWWWDNVVDPLDLDTQLGPLAQLLEGIDFPAEDIAVESSTTTASDGRPLKVFVLRGRTTAVAWIKNSDHLWHSPDLQPVASSDVFLDGLASGPWSGFWLDSFSGETTPAAAEGGDEGGAVVRVPSFVKDVALRLERSPE